MPELVAEGVNLAIYGMGAVFAFLILLVAATVTMSRLVARFEPQPVRRDPAVAEPVADNRKQRAAIAAAIHHHRQGRQG